MAVGGDLRPHTPGLKSAFIEGALTSGCDVTDIGDATSPLMYFATIHLQTSGGVNITASHNPAPWNGLKMFGADGAVLSASNGAIVRGLFESGDFTRAAWNGIGEFHVPPEVHDQHAQCALDQVSVASVASAGFRVFLDANGGAGGPLGAKLLRDLGCEVCECECQPTGHFAHEPEPTPAHLVDVAPWVQRNECAVGFVLDPDADRLALIDETGTCVSEEATLALAVKYRLMQERGPVVVNMSTSRMSEDLARAAGCEFFRSAVGEANVVAKMREVGALIGGEGNGGVIDPRVGWVRDPFIGMALILSLMAEEKKPLSQLVAELPRFAMVKTKYEVPREKLAAAFAALQARWPDAKLNREDGLRLDGPDWWLHVRGSNTEPVVRAIAEAPTEHQVNDLLTEAATAIRS